MADLIVRVVSFNSEFMTVCSRILSRIRYHMCLESGPKFLGFLEFETIIFRF